MLLNDKVQIAGGDSKYCVSFTTACLQRPHYWLLPQRDDRHGQGRLQSIDWNAINTTQKQRLYEGQKLLEALSAVNHILWTSNLLSFPPRHICKGISRTANGNGDETKLNLTAFGKRTTWTSTKQGLINLRSSSFQLARRSSLNTRHRADGQTEAGMGFWRAVKTVGSKQISLNRSWGALGGSFPQIFLCLPTCIAPRKICFKHMIKTKIFLP